MTTSPIRALLLLLLALAACDPLTSPGQEVLVLEVAPYRQECVGVAPMQCLVVRRDGQGDWQLFYDPIEGFEHRPGYAYRLRVIRRTVRNPPADGSSASWHLVDVLEMKRVEDPGT